MLGTLCGVRQQCVDVLFFHGGVPISAPKSPTAITAVRLLPESGSESLKEGGWW